MIDRYTIDQLEFLAELTSYPEGLKKALATQEERHPAKVDYYRFFFQLSKARRPKLCVELGSNKGVAAACLALGNPEGKVISIDIEDKKKFPGCSPPNLEFWIQDSLAPLKYPLKDIDILFIDTSSKGTRNKEEYDYWISKMSPRGIVFIDDIFIVKDIKGRITTDFMAEFWRLFEPNGTKFELPLHGVNGFGGVLLNG